MAKRKSRAKAAPKTDQVEVNQGGRPTKITPEITKKITDYILMGSYVETAATASGITKDTFYRWLKQGMKDRDAGDNDTLEAKFSDAVDRAVGEAEQRDLYRIDAAANEIRDKVEEKKDILPDGTTIVTRIITKGERGDWRAAAWKLERRAPKRWGHKAALKIEDGEKEGFTDDENIHAEMARLVAEHEKGE